MPKYMIHFHKSRKPHYDLRLEHEGVAKSWAIPKEPPKSSKEKRLAVQVEDHSIKHMGFEGIIPEDQYGAGKVKIWDKGAYKPIAWKDEKIVIEIKGKKLKGTYCLIYFRPKNWLFFKKNDRL